MTRSALARMSLLALALAVTACAASRDTLRAAPAGSDEAPTPPARVVPRERSAPPALVLAADEFGFGTTVVLDRLPEVRDLEAFHYITGLTRVVLQLPAWPAGWDRLQPLAQLPLPEDAEYLVIVPGYPPTRAAADAWNQVSVRVRLVALVQGPPADRASILELNSIRALDRVVADMEHPSRAGFERLQRPLSFRVVMP